MTSSQLTTPFHLDGNYRPVTTELTESNLRVEGTIPEQLNGRYLRNGPNPRPGTPSAHWFYGDGMIHGVELSGGHARWYRNRWVRTTSFTDNATLLRPDFGVDRAAGLANTNVIAHAGRTLALVETSFPYELTDELDTVGPYDFDGRLSTAMTAHPKICPTSGELHFFGYALTPPYLTYHCANATGRLLQSTEIDVPGPTMMHDFAITATHMVFFDLPVVFDIERALAGTMPFRWDDTYGARIGLLPRSQPDGRITWHEIEPCYVFHVFNAYDSDDGIVIDALRYAELWRTGPEQFGGANLHRWTLLHNGSPVRETPLDDNTAEFPRIDDRRTGLPHRFGYAINHTDPRQGHIVRYDLDAAKTDAISVGPGRIPSEAVFVPASTDADEHDGYLLTFVYDTERDTSALVVLRADEPTAPPVAEVHLSQRVPFGFHGNWIPANL
jgi:carotenoid cleavage dioxygenase